MFGKAVLIVSGLMYLVFGVAFLFAPAKLGAWVHLDAAHPVARTELRAFYGGLEIGLAVFLCLCAWRSEWVKAGLLAAALIFGCTAAGRVVGMAVDGARGTAVVAILVVEVAFAVVAALAFVRMRGRAIEEQA